MSVYRPGDEREALDASETVGRANRANRTRRSTSARKARRRSGWRSR
jgi:hypothetical protein